MVDMKYIYALKDWKKIHQNGDSGFNSPGLIFIILLLN